MDIPYIKGPDNNVADTLSRIKAIGKSVDHSNLAAAQENDTDLRYRVKNRQLRHMSATAKNDTLIRSRRKNMLRYI
jgi:hypothetical protein